MTVTTWSFTSSLEGWTFSDAESIGGASSSQDYDAGNQAIQNTLNTPLPGATHSAIAINISPSVFVPVQNGDTIDVDFDAASDAQQMGIVIRANYTDSTREEFGQTVVGAGTRTLTMTVSKTLENIHAIFVRGGSIGVGPETVTQDYTEVRLTTVATPPVVASYLRVPSSVLVGAGGGFSNIADISANGTYVYLAMFNNLGHPTIVKISSSLTADGTIVFEPGAGSRIGVQCGLFDADLVYTAGQFDGTNTVEKSEDAGSSFSVIDDGSFGEIRSFEVGPDSDNRIIIFDQDNNDILESKDGGATWTTINASVTPDINTIARFGQNPEEIVAGNQGGASDSISYSVNSGANLEDYQTGVYPNADATKVIAN